MPLSSSFMEITLWSSVNKKYVLKYAQDAMKIQRRTTQEFSNCSEIAEQNPIGKSLGNGGKAISGRGTVTSSSMKV